MEIFVGIFLGFTLDQVQGAAAAAAAAQVLSTLLFWPEVKIYEGAAADVDADDALIAEPEERDEEEGEENKQGRKFFGHVFLKSMERVPWTAYGPSEI